MLSLSSTSGSSCSFTGDTWQRDSASRFGLGSSDSTSHCSRTNIGMRGDSELLEPLWTLCAASSAVGSALLVEPASSCDAVLLVPSSPATLDGVHRGSDPSRRTPSSLDVVDAIRRASSANTPRRAASSGWSEACCSSACVAESTSVTASSALVGAMYIQ